VPVSLQVVTRGAASRRTGSVERAFGHRMEASPVVHEDACTRTCLASASQRRAAAWPMAGRVVRHVAHANPPK
jgi:hypothetical protein